MSSNLPPLPDSGSVLNVLVVDDDESVRSACREIARTLGYGTHGADSVQAARAVMKGESIDVLLLDLKLPGGGGISLLEEVKSLYPETVVIVMTAHATVNSAVEAMRIGASEYLTKPFAMDELSAMLERASERRHFDRQSRLLRGKMKTEQGFGKMVGRSPEMDRLYRIITKVAFASHPVLILGESGTGKELAAKCIHYNGPNASQPFVPVDCSSIAPGMIEGELFGYAKTAAAGPQRPRPGLLSAAEGGTILLDEISELPADMQGKLLRALQERQVRPVGATQAVPINVRILAASSKDLSALVQQGKFRKDLYYRLNIVNLKVPPLRDRKQDIPLLAAHFLQNLSRHNEVPYTLSDDVLRTLVDYNWPGNVRELENTIERACTFASAPELSLGNLPTQLQDFRMHMRREREEKQAPPPPTEKLVTTPTMAELEKRAILETLRLTKGDKLLAAKLLDIGKTTLYRKLKEYGMNAEHGPHHGPGGPGPGAASGSDHRAGGFHA